jgi:methionyl-tRNA formyltransferase
MRAFFIGTVHFSREMLNSLLNIPQLEIVGLATKSSSSFNSDHTDLSDLAIKNMIPYKHVRDINSLHIIEWIRQINPNVIFCLGWSSLISKELIAIPPLGVIGYHPAELPSNKGRHPQIWAMALGLEYTASTFFFIDEKPDSGDIINQCKVKIEIYDTAQSLYLKIIEIAKFQLLQIVSDLINGTIHRIPQPCNTGNYWRKRTKYDGRIDWRMRTIDIYNLVRALSHPYPGAYFDYLGREIKVWKCSPYSRQIPVNIEPGKVIGLIDGEIIVKTGDGAIVLNQHELTEKSVNSYLL